MSVDNPLKWLLNRLPYEIQSSAQLSILMQDYEANKAAYTRQLKINQTERMVKHYARRNNPSEAATLARWKARLAVLKKEEKSA